MFSGRNCCNTKGGANNEVQAIAALLERLIVSDTARSVPREWRW